ncbi:MAG: ATP-binding protein, partial [Melioribacteraceae bacterium]|nr:ATP-binding protein [Melioribacteraceae bacterium]
DVPTTKIGGKKEKGTGLGLIISSMFAKENEGELKVSSEPNKGSKFTLSLKEYRENRTREHKYLEE